MRNHENSFYYTFLGIFFVFVFLLWCYRLASRLSVQNARKREKDFVEYSKKFISTFPSPLPSSFSSPSPSSSFFSKTFEPIVLRGKKFRNRILKAATYEAGCDINGSPLDSLIKFHKRTAQGGCGMSIVAYGAVSPAGRSFTSQLILREKNIPQLQKLTDAIHSEGSLAGIQITHAGYFAKRYLSEKEGYNEQFSAKRLFNPSEFNFCRPMTKEDEEHIVLSFSNAAKIAVDSGFDCVEIHCGHGYLLSQCLSPFTNKGASRSERVSLTIRVLNGVRKSIGENGLIMVKMNANDGVKGGLELEDVCAIAQTIARECSVDILAISGGMILENGLYMLRGGVPLEDMAEAQPNFVTKFALWLLGPFLVPSIPFHEAFFREAGGCILRAVEQEKEREREKGRTNEMHMCLIGGIQSYTTLNEVLDKDNFSFVQCGRALLYDPDIVKSWQKIDEIKKKNKERREGGEGGEKEGESACNRCNLCIVHPTMSQVPLECLMNPW